MRRSELELLISTVTINNCFAGCCRGAEQRVRINVSGYHFETALGVLERHPSTLLGDRQ